MKIETTKDYIALVNFHGASFARPEWTFSKSGDGSDLDLYHGAAVCCGDKGGEKEWFIVENEKVVPVADAQAAKDRFLEIAHEVAIKNSK